VRAAARACRDGGEVARASEEHRHHDHTVEQVVVIAAIPISGAVPDVAPVCGADPGFGWQGVLSDQDSVVTTNLFQQNADDWGWWLPGPPLWIPRPVLPHP
jgi:hypothetical protein